MKKFILIFLFNILYAQLYNWDELYYSIGEIRKGEFEKVIKKISKIKCKNCNIKRVIEELRILSDNPKKDKRNVLREYYHLILQLVREEINYALEKRENFKVVSIYPSLLTILRFLRIEERDKTTYYRVIELLREIQKYQRLRKLKARDSVLYNLNAVIDSVISSS